MPQRKAVSVWHSMCAFRAVASELYRAETAGCAYSRFNWSTRFALAGPAEWTESDTQLAT